MFRVITAMPPSGAHPHSFPGRGPVCYHLFLTGTRLGYGWGGGLRGTGAGNAEKDTPPQAIEWGGAGKRVGGLRFSGPRPPRNKLYLRTMKLPSLTFKKPTFSRYTEPKAPEQWLSVVVVPEMIMYRSTPAERTVMDIFGVGGWRNSYPFSK